MIVFRYQHLERPDGTLRKAPVIPLYMRNKHGRVMRVLALVDSGADTTVIPKELAVLLGLEEKASETETTAGIGGHVEVTRANCSFVIKGKHESHTITLNALVIQDVDSPVPPLLGRNGFFEHFHITFKQNEEKLILKKVAPNRQ